MTTSVVYHRPALYPRQLAAIFDPARYSIVEASPKSGKTVGCLIWLLEQGMASKAGRNFWWIAPVYSQAQIAFRRLQHAIPREIYTAREDDLTVTLANGAALWFKTGEKPDALYGEDVYAAVIDEATRVREESWHAVRTTLTATRGPLRIIGNVKGRRNWAYQLARRAEAGEPDMAYHKLVAADAVAAGILDAAEIADAERMLPPAVFRELYLAEASDDQGNPFDLEAIRDCLAPLAPGPAVCWGWDLAKSVDYTVGVALDVAGRCCAFERFQRPWQETMDTIARVTGKTPATIDSTGVGDPIVEGLQRRGVKAHGYHFTPLSKQQLMEGLAAAIQQRTVHYPDGPIRSELEAFEYVYTRTGVRYAGAPGVHDDCVCALALAVEGLSSRPHAKGLHQPSTIRKRTAGVAWARSGRPFGGG